MSPGYLFDPYFNFACRFHVDSQGGGTWGFSGLFPVCVIAVLCGRSGRGQRAAGGHGSPQLWGLSSQGRAPETLERWGGSADAFTVCSRLKCFHDAALSYSFHTPSLKIRPRLFKQGFIRTPLQNRVWLPSWGVDSCVYFPFF